MVLEQPQAIPPARQAGPAQEPLHRCGGHGRRALASQVGGDPPAAPRGPRERHAQDPPFPGQGELARPAPAGLMSPGMQSIGPIALEARSPAIEQGAPDPARSCGPWPARSNADTEPRAAAAAGPSTAPEPLRGGRCPGGPTRAQRRGGVPRRCRQRLLRAEKRRRRGVRPSPAERLHVCHGPTRTRGWLTSISSPSIRLQSEWETLVRPCGRTRRRRTDGSCSRGAPRETGPTAVGPDRVSYWTIVSRYEERSHP